MFFKERDCLVKKRFGIIIYQAQTIGNMKMLLKKVSTSKSLIAYFIYMCLYMIHLCVCMRVNLLCIYVSSKYFFFKKIIAALPELNIVSNDSENVL